MTPQNLQLQYLHGKDPGPAPGVAYPLMCHLLDTLVVAEVLWDSRVRPGLRARIAAADTPAGKLGEVSARAAVLYAAVLHDVGKANPWFQFQDRVTASSAAWSGALSESLGLPPTDSVVSGLLRADPTLALRRHEYVTYRALAGDWALGDTPVASAEWIGTIAGGHHGYWRTLRREHCPSADLLLPSEWHQVQDAVIEHLDALVEKLTGVRRADIPALVGRDGALVVVTLSGLITQADWIASDDEQVAQGKLLFREGMDPTLSVEEARHWVEVRGQALADHADRSLGRQLPIDAARLQAEILGDYSPRPLQIQAIALADATGSPSEDAPGLWVVMYPTGDGKTEAAGLRHAGCPEEGLLFGLPTRATTDAMEERISAWFARLGASVIKSHQFAELDALARPHDSDDEGDACGNALWYTNALRKLAAPNVVATCDQVLAGALKQRQIAMRLFHLANHHIVLDEVHTFDTYQTELLVELLHWWGATGTRVTLLSATLPRAHLERMVSAYRLGVGASDEPVPATTFPGSVFVPSSRERPMLPLTPGEGASRRLAEVAVDVAFARDRNARIQSHVLWAQMVAATHPHCPIGVFSNTVGDCIAIARQLAEDRGVARTHDVLCVHSAMVAAHRAVREGEILSRLGKRAHEAGFDSTDPARRPAMVVGTQVLQASLDIDFDFASSDLAPAPDLIQRMGRQWRFVDDPDGIPAQRLRRTGTGHRAFRIIGVCEADDRTVTTRGAPPYLVSTLQNTLAWLLERTAAGNREPIDLITESQAWVDRSFEKRLLSEIPKDEYPGDDDSDTARPSFAHDRVAQDAMHVQAAAQSKALIAPTHGKGLLRAGPVHGRRRRPCATWDDLVDISHFDVDEALMRTRFIDHEPLSILLFDEGGIVEALGVGTDGREVRIRRMPGDLANLGPSAASTSLDMMVRVTGSIARDIEAALVKNSIGWNPRSKVLASTPPVDIKHLPDLTYSRLTGLSRREA